MNQFNINKKTLRVIYTILSVLFLFFILGNEFFWRYESTLDLKMSASLWDTGMKNRNIRIYELSDTPVDTTRREFKNILHGKTEVLIVENGIKDSIRFTLSGKYISEVRRVHISSDSSSQLLLIPNTVQGMPSGWNRLLYLQNDSLKLLEFAAFIDDVDKDGNEEVNIPEEGGWVRLNTETGKWIPAILKSSKTTL